jgi:hypothetical protein
VVVGARALQWPPEAELAAGAAVASALRVAVLVSGFRLPAWVTQGPRR